MVTRKREVSDRKKQILIVFYSAIQRLFYEVIYKMKSIKIDLNHVVLLKSTLNCLKSVIKNHRHVSTQTSVIIKV